MKSFWQFGAMVCLSVLFLNTASYAEDSPLDVRISTSNEAASDQAIRLHITITNISNSPKQVTFDTVIEKSFEINVVDDSEQTPSKTTFALGLERPSNNKIANAESLFSESHGGFLAPNKSYNCDLTLTRSFNMTAGKTYKILVGYRSLDGVVKSNPVFVTVRPRQ